MRIALAALLLAAFALGCSHGRHHDEDRGGAEYNSRPDIYRANRGQPPTAEDGSILALIGAVALGMNPGYYKSSTLGGKCVVKTGPNDPLGAPCGNMVIVLIDQQSEKEITRKPCSSAGEFSFKVQEGRKYLLKVASERYVLAGDAQGPFTQGQELLITLNQKAPKK